MRSVNSLNRLVNVCGGYGLSRAAGIVYTFLSALNASNPQPLTALTGTSPTQVATSSVVVPVYASTLAAGTTLTTIAANNPAIPGAGYRDGNWYATDSAGAAIATPTVLASGLTRYDGSGLGVLAQPAWTNKCTCRKYNPTDTTNITDPATRASVADDTAALTASGLFGLCSLGKAYKIDNSDNASAYDVSISGTVGNTNTHSASIYARASQGSGRALVTGVNFNPVGDFSSDSYSLIIGNGITPPNSSAVLTIRAQANSIVYFILPSLTETTTAPPFPVVTLPTDAAAASTMAARYTSIPGSNLGTAFNFVLYSLEALAAGGRDVTLLYDGTRKVVYQGAAGLLAFVDISQNVGTEKITNGTFATDTTGWTAGNSAGLSVVSGTLRITNDAANTGFATQGITTTAGKTYRLLLTGAAGTASPFYRIGTTSGGGEILGSTAATGNISTTFVAAGATTYITLRNSSATITQYADYDNVSVFEVAQLTADLDIAASTQTHIGLDLGTAASMSVEGTEVATATFPAAVEWGETVYIGSKVVTGTASETLSGTLSVIQSSSDAKFDEASAL